MIKKLFQNQAEKAGKEFWLLNQDKIALFFFYLLILFLPTQLGKHFFPNFTFVYGLRIDYLSPTVYLTDVFVLLIFIFSLKAFIPKLWYYKKNFFYFLLFVLFLSLGAVTARNTYAAYFGILKFLEVSLLTTYIYFNYKKINKYKLIIFLSAGIILESILAILQIINQGSLQGIFYFLGERSYNSQTPGIANAQIFGKLLLRPYGTFAHPNVLAGFLDLSMMLLFLIKNKFNKHLNKLILLLGTVGVLISLSRSAIITWFLFLTFLFVFAVFKKYKKRKVNKRMLAYLLTAIITLILLFVFFSNSILVQRFTSLSLSDESVVQREILVGQSLKMIMNNPVFGVGVNNFFNNLTPNFNSPLLIQPVHNIFLLVFSQTGIIGIVAFAYLFFAMLRNSIRGKINIYKLGIIFSIILLGSLDHYLLTIQQGQFLFAIIIGLCLTTTN